MGKSVVELLELEAADQPHWFDLGARLAKHKEGVPQAAVVADAFFYVPVQPTDDRRREEFGLFRPYLVVDGATRPAPARCRDDHARALERSGRFAQSRGVLSPP